MRWYVVCNQYQSWQNSIQILVKRFNSLVLAYIFLLSFTVFCSSVKLHGMLPKKTLMKSQDLKLQLTTSMRGTLFQKESQVGR